MISKEALKQGVSVDLAIAIAKVESNLITTAVGKYGEIGLFQVMPYHYSQGHSKKDVRYNIQLGVGILKAYSVKCADMGNYWPICFNQGPSRRPQHPMSHPYYKKLVAVMK